MYSVLIVIHGLGCGGAEKSLISFLNYLDKDNWKIDLLVMSPRGLLYKDIPEGIKVIENDFDVENLMTGLNDRRKKIAGFNDLIRQIRWNMHKTGCESSGLKYDEYKWKYWGKYLPCRKKEYDIAISYMHGIPNYYVIEKVKAGKKILWIHNDYQKIGFNNEFEKVYYDKADRIVTISDSCVNSFLEVFPEYQNKVRVLENISSKETITALSGESINDVLWNKSKIRLLSIGRLNAQKGFDIAVSSAKKLKERGYDFVWYILGAGGLRAELESLIAEYGLEDVVKLPGIIMNPYPYIASCTFFVQSSRFEGKSIALDEAKILCKPILVTNYATVKSSIADGVNGKIVEINEDSVADGLQYMLENPDFCSLLAQQLSRESNSNEREIEKYIALIQDVMEE
ncbi:glycosyltransferase [Oribacterium sp. P6A1]|uniref:glycosyltransferase n=1 Tax=Oribacterium sp. P6A1 TaxID=1410612 RepID=UPI00068C6BC0|nr:glycosyltransferase [Oribacterium sp. P6A1]